MIRLIADRKVRHIASTGTSGSRGPWTTAFKREYGNCRQVPLPEPQQAFHVQGWSVPFVRQVGSWLGLATALSARDYAAAWSAGTLGLFAFVFKKFSLYFNIILKKRSCIADAIFMY